MPPDIALKTIKFGYPTSATAQQNHFCPLYDVSGNSWRIMNCQKYIEKEADRPFHSPKRLRGYIDRRKC